MDRPVFETYNTETWSDTYGLYDEYGELVDLTGWTATLRVVPQTFAGAGFGGRAPYSLTGGTRSPVITTTCTNPATGVLEWNVSADEMRGLSAGIYEAGLLLTNGSDSRQAFVGLLTVKEGV